MTNTTNSNFIESLYANVLQTTGDASAINFWVSQQNAGVSAVDITNSFINSAAGNNVEFIIRLYVAFFGRAPDSEGLRYWVGTLNSGIPLLPIANSFINSNEFQATVANTSIANYVEALYNNVLGRVSDPLGKAYWAKAINNEGLSRATVALDFAMSAENLSSSSNSTIFANTFLTMRAAGILEPSIAAVKATGALANAVALISLNTPSSTALNTNPTTAALEATYITNARIYTVDASDATNAATANATASAALLTAQRDPVLTIAQATQAVADANAAVTAANAATAIAPTELTEAVTAHTSAIAVQTAANTASNLSQADIALAGTQVSTSAAAVTLATTNAATATASVGAANTQLTTAIAALAAAVAQANIPNNYFYSDVGLQNNTFTGATVINGAGAGTLSIKSSIVGAMSMGYGGQDWNIADSGFTNLNITNNLGAGAIRLVSSTAFNNAFNGGNLFLTTAISAIGAAGATTITLDGSIAGSVNYSGSATITATNNAAGNAGAINILAGSGATIVNIATTAGEESAGGAGLTSVTMTSYGAGAQNVGTTGASASALANVHLTQLGAGAQTVISSNLAAVTVTAIMGTSSTAGAQTITTSAGSDIITLINNGGFTGSVVLVNAGGGTNQITLAATHTGVNTIVNNAGSWTVGVNQTATVDTIINFVSSTDVIQISKAAYAGNYFGAVGSGNASNTHIGVLTNTTTAVNTAGSSLAGGQITLTTSGALVLIGTNMPGNTLDIYAVASSAIAGNTIAQDIAAHTATLIGHVSIIGAPLTAVNFVSIG